MVDIGGLRLVVGADTSDLKRGTDESAQSMRDLQQQLNQVNATLRATDATLVSFSGQIGGATRQGRELSEVFLRPLKNALVETAVAWGLFQTGLKSSMPEIARFSGSLLENTIQLKRLGLEGAQVTGVLKKMGDDFVQLQPPMRQQVAITGQLAFATGTLAGQFGAMAPQVSQAASALQLLTMGGIVGAVIVGATAAFTALKRFSDEMIELGQNAQFANMSLNEFQRTQKALEITGGLTSEKFASGTEAIARNLFQATRNSTELERYLKANNVEFEKGGKLTLTTGQAIKVMAELIRNAADGAQKLRIASAFGVDRSWVAAVEQGGDALQRLIDQGPKFSSMVDQEMIDKAKAFSEGWRHYTSQALTWFQAWAKDAVAEIAKVAQASIKPDQVVQDARDIAEVIRLALTFRSEEDLQKIRDAVTRLKNSVIADFTGMKDGVVSLMEQTFADEKTKRLIDERARALRMLAQAMNEAMPGPVGQSPRADQGLRDRLAPGPVTRDPAVESAETQHMQRRLDHLRQMIATEDEALKVQRERYLKDLAAFQAAELITREEHAVLKRQVEEKFQKQLADLNFQKFQESFMTETELLARRQEQQLKDLETFEKNKTLIERTEGETRMRLEQEHALKRLQLQASLYSGLASIVDTAMGQIAGIMEDESQKGFTVMKAIAMATALVKGFEAVVSAIAFGNKVGGPVLGAAMGAIAAAGTAAVIAKLAGVGPKSGGTTAGAISGGGGGAVTAATETQQSGGSNQTLTVSGFKANELYSGEMVRALAQKLVDFQRDGGKLVIA